MKKYFLNNLLLIIYFTIHPFLIFILDLFDIKFNFIIIISLSIIILNCFLQSKNDLIFNIKNKRIYYLIISIVNSAISSLLIFIIRLIWTLIAYKGINSSYLMELSWFSLFLLGGFLMMVVFNYISYEVGCLVKKKN